MTHLHPSYITFLTEKDVQSLLDWEELILAIEENFSDVSSVAQFADTLTIQPARGIMQIPHRNGYLLTMPGLSERKKALTCKLVTLFPDNLPRFNIPSILANIAVFNPDNGELQAIVQGTTITEWRTAAASVVATKYLKPEGRDTLAVFGAGKQGRIHIIAFQNYFKFKKVNLWNRTLENAEKLAEELKNEFNLDVEIFKDAGKCAENADVLVTATLSSTPVLKYEFLKSNVLINAVGAGKEHHNELDKSIYEKSIIYTDSMENAKVELKGLIDEGYRLVGEIGEVINGKEVPDNDGVVIFHSLGMATEDAVAAKLVLDKFSKEHLEVEVSVEVSV